MGLDMYLTAKQSICKYDEDLSKVEKVSKIFPEMFKYGNLDTVEIGFEVGYWRKSNQIHKWFVDNCQEGEDDARDAKVSRDDLIKLKETCEKVQKILSEQKKQKVVLVEKFTKEEYEHNVFTDTEEIEGLLPTASGFFFGSTEYDEYYENDLELTIEIINKCLELPEKWSFEYHSSW